jgi:hypothetical protein
MASCMSAGVSRLKLVVCETWRLANSVLAAPVDEGLRGVPSGVILKQVATLFAIVCG